MWSLAAVPAAQAKPYPTKAALGEALFSDVNLSLNRTQACATCHAPAAAFIDIRPNALDAAVSLGDNGVDFGTRNAPTLSYVTQTPIFHSLPDGSFAGGFFYDGRATSLEEQAKIPLTSPVEMGLTGSEMLAKRVAENPAYIDAFERLFGSNVFTDSEALLDAVLRIADFAAHHAARLVELDVNPLLVLPQGRGVVAVDALLRLAEA